MTRRWEAKGPCFDERNEFANCNGARPCLLNSLLFFENSKCSLEEFSFTARACLPIWSNIRDTADLNMNAYSFAVNILKNIR